MYRNVGTYGSIGRPSKNSASGLNSAFGVNDVPNGHRASIQDAGNKVMGSMNGKSLAARNAAVYNDGKPNEGSMSLQPNSRSKVNMINELKEAEKPNYTLLGGGNARRQDATLASSKQNTNSNS